MLVLSRGVGQTLTIGQDITITVIGINRKTRTVTIEIYLNSDDSKKQMILTKFVPRYIQKDISIIVSKHWKGIYTTQICINAPPEVRILRGEAKKKT